MLVIALIVWTFSTLLHSLTVLILRCASSIAAPHSHFTTSRPNSYISLPMTVRLAIKMSLFLVHFIGFKMPFLLFRLMVYKWLTSHSYSASTSLRWFIVVMAPSFLLIIIIILWLSIWVILLRVLISACVTSTTIFKSTLIYLWFSIIIVAMSLTLAISSDWRLLLWYSYLKFILICFSQMEIITSLIICTSKWTTSPSATLFFFSELRLIYLVSILGILLVASIVCSIILVLMSWPFLTDILRFFSSLRCYSIENIFFWLFLTTLSHSRVIVKASLLFTTILFFLVILCTFFFLLATFILLLIWSSLVISIFRSLIPLPVVLLKRSCLLWWLGCLVSRVVLVELVFREYTVICWDISSLLNWAQSFNLGFKLVLDSHSLDFVDLMQISNFALN